MKNHRLHPGTTTSTSGQNEQNELKTDKDTRRTSFHKESNRHKTGQREITQIYCVLNTHIFNYQIEFVISQPEKKDIH